MKKLILLIACSFPIFSQCFGTGCPGSSSSSGVTSFNSRTGAVSPVVGDYTPSMYNCSATTSDGELYACTTGASLSVRPADGTLYLVTFVTGCTTATIVLTVDSLSAKVIGDVGGTTMPWSYCSAANSVAILRQTNSGASAFSLMNILANPGLVGCSQNNGIIFASGTGHTSTCSSVATIDNTNNRASFLKLSGQTGFIPTIALGLAAGTTPTLSMTAGSTDVAGKINITTGTATTTGIEGTVTFNVAFSVAPFCTLTAANAVTALISGTSMIYPTINTTTLVINSGSVALTASTAYAWNYTCIQ